MRAGERGFTYLWLLAVVAVLGLGLAALGPMWAESAQREREEDLLRIGQIYAQAIHDYHQASPGSVKRFPPTLDALLLDTRFVGTRRHLRRLYADPLDPARPWGLVRAPDGGVAGVYSQDTRRPWLRAGWSGEHVALPPAERYADWQFVPQVQP